jgi:hypothetical protein
MREAQPHAADKIFAARLNARRAKFKAVNPRRKTVEPSLKTRI